MDYEKEYNDALERAQRILCNLPEGTTTIRDIESIFPELRESEDERIRHDIMEAVENWFPYERVEEIRAYVYLEKQKSEKPLIPEKKNDVRKAIEEVIRVYGKTQGEWIAGYDMDTLVVHLRNAFAALEMQKEQKPISSCDIVPYIDDKIAALQDMWREEKVAFDWDDMHEMIEDVARHFYQKEQIPYTDFVIKPHKGDDNNPYDMQVSEAQEYAIKRGFGVPFNDGEVYVDERHITQTIGNILRWADDHPKEQKPAEINVKALLAADRLASAEMTGRLKERSEILENPEKYGLQKTAEWSEEDEIGFADAIRYIQDYGETSSDKYTQLRTKEIVAWLKSFRPQPQKLEDWTEEDEKLLSDALACVTMVQEIKKRGELKNFHISCTGEELRSWIRSLKSRPRKQPRWKPSEEQMEVFCRCVDYLEESDNEDADIMAELYEHLKRMI